MQEIIEMGKLLNVFFLSRNWKGNEIDQINKVKQAFSMMEQAVQLRLHLTAFSVGLLAFLAGFGVCWLVFVG